MDPECGRCATRRNPLNTGNSVVQRGEGTRAVILAAPFCRHMQLRHVWKHRGLLMCACCVNFINEFPVVYTEHGWLWEKPEELRSSLREISSVHGAKGF